MEGTTGLGITGFENFIEIGRGGFGVVYRAHQVDFGRQVAVKVLPAFHDDQARLRFERERRAMGPVSNHPHIVTVYGSGFTADGRPYIVMEHMPGGSLADRLGRGPLGWQEAVAIGVKLCSALEAAHREGVLHRDVKPENILISAYSEPKLGDFGIARIQDGHETRSGAMTFSLAHAAPEVFDGKRLTEAADVYALGSTLYSLIAGMPPFANETDESIVPMISRIATAPVPDLRPIGVPHEVASVLEESMAKDPGQRIGSAPALREWLEGARSSAQSAPLSHVGPDPSAANVTMHLADLVPPQAPPPNPFPTTVPPAYAPLPPAPFPWGVVVATLVVVVVLALALLVYALTRGSPATPSEDARAVSALVV